MRGILPGIVFIDIAQNISLPHNIVDGSGGIDIFINIGIFV